MRGLQGRVCLVTGGTSGIGRETAKGLLERGMTVLLTGRGQERAEGVAAELAEETQNPRAVGLAADFSSLAEVRRLAERVRAEHDELHVLIHNAGLFHLGALQVSADGYEDTFAVNHLAPFLLTHLLRETLERAAPSRVVVVSSRLHEGARGFDFDDPCDARSRYRGMRAYGRSKVANVMFSNELARRLAGTGVTSNSLHPGDVATNVVRENAFLQWGLDHIARFFVATAEEGARTSIHLATEPSLERVTGRYFKRCREAKPARVTQDRAACARLWALSEGLVGIG